MVSCGELGEHYLLNRLDLGQICSLVSGDPGKLLIEESLTETLVAHSIKLRREFRSPLS